VTTSRGTVTAATSIDSIRGICGFRDEVERDSAGTKPITLSMQLREPVWG
jgi:hypothetical protein